MCTKGDVFITRDWIFGGGILLVDCCAVIARIGIGALIDGFWIYHYKSE